MDYSAMIGKSFEYSRDAVWGKWGKWIVLVVVYLVNMITFNLIPLFNGYLVRIWRGDDPAPELNDWGRLFIDGWKVNIIGIVYFLIPMAILLFIFGILAIPVFFFSTITNGNFDQIVSSLPAMTLGILIILVVTILISLIALLGTVRFAKTGSLIEAFNIGAIFRHIGTIGWGQYIIALIVLWVAILVFVLLIVLLNAIPVLGWILSFFISPLLSIFTARYIVLIYESAPAPG